jgi:hypothetical protein
MPNEDIVHYGVPGMHWGLKRQLKKNDRIRKSALRTWLPFANKDAKKLKGYLNTHPQLFSKAYINDIVKSSGKKKLSDINKKDLRKGKKFADMMMADTWNEVTNMPSTRYDVRYHD